MLPIRKVILLIFILLLFSNSTWAQSAGRSENTTGPRRQLATIIFAGLSGAILGLSTLSFYGRPQDRLSNIAVGFALGIFGGTIYTTYKAAAKPQEFYGLTGDFELKGNREEKEMSLGAHFQLTPVIYHFSF
ncbi:MAG: hypothetical protein SGJ18_13440 [Pseudomonadota bacterium]|nr:hypothetical protein [Pseudomonadota bacterium]